MDRAQEREHLAQADRHIAELKVHIARQRDIVKRALDPVAPQSWLRAPRAASRGRPAIHPARRAAIRAAYEAGGVGLRVVAAQFGVGVETVRRCVG
jgi:hypothetical protein